MAKFEGLVEKLEAVPGRFTTATDRMEGIIRERTTSVQGDLNKMAGEVSHANREHTRLVRRLTASTDSLQATVANMGAAMSQPPVDSRGTTESLDLLKDMAAQVATLAETTDEVVKELQNRPLPPPQAKAPPREHPAAGSAQTFAAPPGGRHDARAAGIPTEHAYSDRPGQSYSTTAPWQYAPGDLYAVEWQKDSGAQRTKSWAHSRGLLPRYAEDASVT